MEKLKVNKKPGKVTKHGSYSVIAIVVAIAIAVVVNLLVNALPSKYTQIDVSSEKLYSIGDETKNVLGELKDDITIYLIAQESSEDNTISQLLKAYKNESSHIKIVKKDPALYPGFTSKYTTDTLTENSVIVECGDRFKIVNYDDIYLSEVDYSTYETSVTGFDGEGQITSAIAYVTSEDVPKLYMVEGHNESDMDADLKSTIEKMNIEIDTLNLLTSDSIPDDAQCLMLLAPQSDYSQEDAQKVINYMNHGGKVFIVTNYTNDELTNFATILNACNLKMEKGVIIDMASGRYAQQNPMYLVPEISTKSNLSESLRNTTGYVFAPISQGLTVTSDDADVTVTQILTTSDSSYLKADPQNMETYTKEDGDLTGPFTVGASAYKLITEDTSSEEHYFSDQMQAVVYTSASFMTKSADGVVSGGNFNLIKSSLSWMIKADATVSVPSKDLKVDYLTITASKITLWTIVVAVIIPALFIVIGGAVWFVRRKK